MPITSEQMVKDLRLMNEAVSRTSDILDGGTKQQFRETSARYLETLANRIDLQRIQERGIEQLSRSEVEFIMRPNADRLIERAQEVRVNQGQEAGAAIDPTSQRELRAERTIVTGSQQSAAREAREVAAADSGRVIAEHPPEQLFPTALVQTDALARLRAEQEQIVRELEANKGISQSIKGRRMT